MDCKMTFLMVFYILSTLTKINSNTVTSPQIRILDVATKASESRLTPHRVHYQNTFHPYIQQQNHYEQTAGPLKSYIIYDEYPVKIFKEWKANPPVEFSKATPQKYHDLRRQQNIEFSPSHYFRNEQQISPLSKPTLAYHSVYSNVIKVFDNSLGDSDQNRFQSEKYTKPFEPGAWKSQNPIEYEPIYPKDILRQPLHHNLKLPENFPKIFLPNEKFHIPSFSDAVPPLLKVFYPQEGFYNTYTINYDKETATNPEEVEVLPEVTHKQKNLKKTFLCSFIKVNQRQFPNNGGPCARSDEDLPLLPPEYPDYSSLPNCKIPLEHRRQHFQMKRIKRSEPNQSNESRKKRNAEFGYGYGAWVSPFGYENGYDGYFGGNYPVNGGYRKNYNSGYSRNRNQSYKNKYYSGGRYDDYDEDYQNNDDSNSRGLSSYLTSGGRRYKNRKNNNDDEDEDEDEDNENNSNNREDDSDEEMEQMNSNRRDTNERRNNDDSRDRRRNNNNNNNSNDDDDYRDNRRNNNRNNNSRRYNNNNNNNNNSNSNRRYSDRYDYNNRNRYYGNSNGYNNNGYGSSYGSYGSNYGGSYGNGGYGSGYGSNGGYGYGGYGNGFGSF